MGCTIPEALGRLGDDLIPLIPQIAKMVAAADAVMADARDSARQQTVLEDLSANQEVVDVNTTLVTYGNAPDYRDVSLTFDLQRFQSTQTHRVCLRVTAKDGLAILRHIVDVNRFAWRQSD
jgi:hypothetical protein